MRKIIQFITKYLTIAKKWVYANPFSAFFGLLGLLLVLVVVGNLLRRPPAAATEVKIEPKLVDTFKIGESPRVALTGKIEESGLITIMAQSAGVIQNINVTEGKAVTKGASLGFISATYSGANPSSVSRQIAEKNAENAKTAYEYQKEIIEKQKEIAEKSADQAGDLREISIKSLEDSRNLLSLNSQILNNLDKQITYLESINVNGASDSAIMTARQGKASLLAGVNQLQASVRQLEYSTDSDNPPSQLPGIQKEMTLKQLDLQMKSAALAADIAALNVKLARINESLSYPVSPFTGIVERVFVKKGQAISPGTPLMTIKANQRELSLVVTVPVDLARQVSRSEPSIVNIDTQKFQIFPRYVSIVPNDGSNAGAIFYTLPPAMLDRLEGESIVAVEVPMGISKVVADDPYIPIDAVYQTDEKAYIYVVKSQDNQQIAAVKEVTLGNVAGRFINVTAGLQNEDVVIITRGITEGDVVRTE